MTLDELINNAPLEIRNKFTHHRFVKGDHILYAGEKNEYLFFLIKGDAEVYTLTHEGVMLSLNSYHATSFFGEYEVFDPNSTTLSIIAKTDCKVIRVHKSDLFRWMKNDFELALKILNHFASDVINSHKMNMRLAHLTIKERVLISVNSHYTMDNLKNLTKGILVQEALAPIRSVNRALASLKSDGILDYRKKQFLVTDEALLKKAVNQIADL